MLNLIFFIRDMVIILFIYLYICIPVSLSSYICIIYSFIHLLIHTSIRTSVRPSVHPFMYGTHAYIHWFCVSKSLHLSKKQDCELTNRAKAAWLATVFVHKVIMSVTVTTYFSFVGAFVCIIRIILAIWKKHTKSTSI